MAWLDDRIWAHPKITSVSVTARWVYVSSLCYSSGFGLGGILRPSHQKLVNSTPRTKRELLSAGLWEDAGLGDNSIEIHDWVEHNSHRDAAAEDRRFTARRRKQLHRDAELRATIRDRDGENCRYCSTKIDWKDRKSSHAATYDHVDPFGDNSVENVVVACNGCNSRKGQRTPEQANMVLRPAPLRSAPPTPPVQIRSRSDQVQSSPESTPASRASAGAPPMTSDRVTEEPPAATSTEDRAAAENRLRLSGWLDSQLDQATHDDGELDRAIAWLDHCETDPTCTSPGALAWTKFQTGGTPEQPRPSVAPGAQGTRSTAAPQPDRPPEPEIVPTPPPPDFLALAGIKPEPTPDNDETTPVTPRV